MTTNISSIKKLLTLIFVVFLWASPHTFSQNYSSSNRKAVRQFEQAIAYQLASDMANAETALLKAVELDPSFSEAHLSLADMYMDQQRYQEAIDHYQRFLQLDKRHKSWQKDARHGISVAQFRIDALAHPVDFSPKNLGANINSSDDEYFPTLTVDEKTLIFTRRSPRKPTTTANTPQEEDFFYSQWEEGTAGGKWGVATRMDEPVNSNDNEGAQCISQDGRILFFTACGREDGGGRCDLYMSVRTGGEWSKPRNLGPYVNSGSWEAQPSFSIDGKTLYFASDRRGGYGGMDLWKTVFIDGHWSTPENLGPTINTPGNEMSPFINYDDQTLFFSSDGHIGMGGQDLFRSQKSDTGWTRPVNLGYPINTEGNESGLIVSPEGTTAFFASEREGGYGGQDLYKFSLPSFLITPPTWHITGTVYDKKSQKRLKSNILVTNATPPHIGETVAEVTSDPLDGHYTISLPDRGSYTFHITADGYLFYSEHFDCDSNHEENIRRAIFVRDIFMTPIEIGEGIVLNNVLFEYGTSNLLEESFIELNKVVFLLQKNTTLRVELGGHTDNIGKPADNLRLSEQRAKAVYDYLVAHGIESQRLTYKGYGESQPVADNATPEGRQKNRRTTFTIIEN